MEPQLAYTKDFGAKGGKLTGLIGTTFQKNTGLGTIINGTGYNSDIVLEDIKSAASNSIQSSINNVYKYGAVFARLNYDFEEKYVLNLTARRDGSSRFGPANKFQTFGALGLAWIFTKETSIEKALPFLDFGKFRFSYGITGNDQVGEYSFLDLYSSTNVGVPYQGANGLQNGRLFTPDLQWEQTRKIEAGLELGFLKDRIVFTTNFYTNRSSNQLVDYALPSITGFISIKRNLPATVQNNGVELSLNTINLSNKVFQWKTGFNFSLNRNKLISVSPGMSSFYNNLVGHPISASFVYSFLGVDPASGKYIVSDSHGNAQLTAANATIDKNFLIDLNPRFYGGIQNSLTFNHIELDFLFQFVKQSGSNYLYSGVPGGFAYGNQPTTVLNRWQKPGDLASIQRFTQTFSLVSTSYNNALGSNQPYSDASFVRLKNLSISYQLNGKWLSKTSIQNARIYLQGQNLLTITNYKGLDPENQSSTSLPPLRVLTFGIQLTL